MLLGAAALALLWAPMRHFTTPAAPSRATPQAAAKAAPAGVQPPRLADFGGEPASPEARQIANWALHSGDNGQRAMVVIDKKAARVYLFDPQGQLRGATPALLGSAVGDHTVPGVGDKPIAQVLPEERTTPAGRFVAEPGMNTQGEDIIWVDYDAAVSMHRVRASVKAERRLERLASPTPEDNRISYGCINLPVAFYEGVLRPAVRSTGAIVYVLPETRPAAAFFGAYEVPASTQLAQR
ncbi:conserved hypothetical protein [Ramlibacter tataouinensis TTB310]|uniref:L,D-TPase catalytic domain-containing protein n=1 Tax=Ramlibacter tataouinensis (strain ATCC BAA-407 / DSM 14655 / LMG 21543 / TTB310) TaxID=365046 RepID=F5Y529_RAMTT|nr:conserved hypothetical protein [Ramlibacter tataouinensis TTB310]